MLKTPASLLERLQRPGHPDDWARFVRLYTPMIYHWACRTGLDEDEAADLVQDVLLLLVEKLPQFRYDPDMSFRAWLKTVTLNKWREGLRRRGGKLQHLRDGELLDPKHADVAAIFEEAEYRRRLLRRAAQLIQADFQPVTRRAFWEYAILGRPAAEVAADLKIAVHSVYLAKSRVLRRLREELDGLLD